MASVKTYALSTESSPVGLYVSTDLGLTWTIATATGLSASQLNDIKASPYDSEQLLIGSNTGISKSVDGGESFTNVYTGESWRLFYKDQNSIISVPASASGEIVISDNNGNAFIGTGITPANLAPSGVSSPRIGSVFFTNNSSGFVSVSWTDPVLGIINRIWRTTNGGILWTNSIDLVASDIESMHGDLDSDKLIIATESDGVWQVDYALLGVITQLYTPALINCGVGAKLHQVVADPSKVYLITALGSIYYSSDSGTSLTQRYAGFGTASPYPGIYAYDENILVIFVSLDAKIYRSEDGGVTLGEVFDASGRTIALDSSVPYDCGECPDGFTQTVSTIIPPTPSRCERVILGGPLCNPPYFYDTVTNSCALPSSTIPFNIILNIDTSGSVIDDEREDLIIFLELFFDEMAARLATGNTQIGVVLWNSLSCYQQTFTSDLVLLKESLQGILYTDDINPICTAAGYQRGGGTQHAVGFAESVRAIHAQAILRPTAENVIIVITDGTGIGNCNLTDLGYSVVVNSSNCQLMALSDQVKANLAGKPSKVMFLAIGTTDERTNLLDNFSNAVNCPGTARYYPSLNNDGQPYYYDGGDFSQVADFAKQLVIGLEAQFIPSFSCPDDCIDVPGSDNLGYCSCTEVLPLTSCNFILTDCLDPTLTIITDTDLSSYLSQVITIDGQDNCFSVATSDVLSSNAQTVIVNESYGSCGECALSFKFINCRDNTVSVYSIQDYSQYVDPNRVVNLEEYPGECWTIIRNTDATYTPEIVTVNTRTFETCIDCLGNYFYLTSCSEEQSFIMTDTDLTEYLNQVVSVVGYPGACFIVEREACNCISVRMFSRVSGLATYKIDRSPVLLNGKNQYTILTNKNERILIAFNTEENRWEVWNINTDTLLSYSILATDCPYTGIWENVVEADFRMIAITSCVTSIYAVEIEDTYLGCECCLFKNC